MKQCTTLFEKGEHKWQVLHKNPTRPDHLISTNEYLIQNGNHAIITDPGGTEVFPEMISAISEQIDLSRIEKVFCSHQDPDVFSSVALWMQIQPDLKVLLPSIWIGFMLHFGSKRSSFELIPDEGGSVDLGSINLKFIPAHHMHASGNQQLYDPIAKILFSGDTGASLMPRKEESLYVKDFAKHIQYIEYFHRRWFGSNEHKNQWCQRVAKLDIEMLCPQHGAIYRGKQINEFLDWLYELKVGMINY